MSEKEFDISIDKHKGFFLRITYTVAASFIFSALVVCFGLMWKGRGIYDELKYTEQRVDKIEGRLDNFQTASNQKEMDKINSIKIKK